MRLRCVGRLAAWRVDFSEEDARAVFQQQRVTGEDARDAAFFAALQIADLRPAGGEEDEREERAKYGPPAVPSLRISVAAS